MKRRLIRSAVSKERLEMIYISGKNQISQRIIRVLAVKETSIQAYCYMKKQFRTFKLENILSVYPASRKKGA